jgi:hypothetical protein
MGMVLEAEESDFQGYLKDNEIFPASVVSVKKVSRKNRDGEEYDKLTFKFKIQQPDDPHDGQEVYGDTSTKFVTHPGCKLYDWAGKILGKRIPAGYRLDTDQLLDQQCRIVVGYETYTDKDGRDRERNWVRDIMPTRENMAALAEENEEPF